MSQLKEDDVLNVFYEIQNQENSREVNKIRKTIVFNYSSTLNLMNGRNHCLLLDNNLKTPCHKNLIKECKDKIYQRNCQRQFSLQNKYSDPTIANLPCSQKPMCEQSEKVTEESFQQFLTLFSEKHNKKGISTEKQRTFAKRFVPQISNNGKENNVHCPGNDAVLDRSKNPFKTAREEFISGQKRKLGNRRGIGSKFVSPMMSNESIEGSSSKSQEWTEKIDDDRLKNLEPRMIELIKSEIMDKGPTYDWDDIAGLEFAKNAIQEAVVWPMLRPDIFTGLRRPPKGILLFGPPGTGKTLIGKCVASQSKSTFFSISASSLTSKWIGDGEKMVRALFVVARCHQPAVIFIDEIDSLLSQRSDTEHECSRRIKTEFLVQLDGATTDNDEKLLVIGATNRPQELDEAARRRFVKRLYIPLPELEARRYLVKQLMANEKHELKKEDLVEIANLSEGYSGADMRNLCADASMGPVRSIDMRLIQSIDTTQVRPINMDDFRKAFARVKSSVSPNDLDRYVKWNKTYGLLSLS